ncbi:tripeptidyl peptidase A [Coprinopsis cinerea okayama7|uniref:tripeptidyl-peptidase II n=1 Tax=Coprinopsis cinerea (strain Okayama-7 / 130 / ATCC MYA-4618 / FGSC 9003) TaxID=240176 RepID=A8NYU1_COPC7|nr:tripeptidyl peptidase A [Coprinopsis cinerea okayama7\|eukprot:XP_001837523.1 tripeptidyl peptidase A [Coprinopsis cinerea okayama7\
MLVLLLSAIFLSAADLSQASSAEFKVKESIHPPPGWTRLHKPPSDHTISLRIALPQPHFNILEKHLYEVSDPDHPRYGAYLSKEDVEKIIAPHPASLEAVNTWLQKHGFEEVDYERSPANDWVNVNMPVALAERILQTEYHVWEHNESGDQLVRTTSYSLPEDLHDHIELIQPTTIFARWGPMKSALHWPDADEAQLELLSATGDSQRSERILLPNGVEVDPHCNHSITISCLKQLYRTEGYIPQNPFKTSIGVTGYLEEFANEQDLQSFFADQLPGATNPGFKFVSVKGGLNNQTLSEAGAEANLDVQFAFGLAYPIPGTFWSTAGRPPFKPDVSTPTNTNEPYLDWVNFVLSQKDVPHAISTSYGEPEQTVPRDYALRVCRQLAQLSARGVSLMFSSGDGGVGDASDDPEEHDCFTNDGQNKTRFLPNFPATCPYVTAVGGTNDVPETAVFFSGGGFSDYFRRPNYQNRVVPAFLESVPSNVYGGLYNREGRGLPDVAAQGRRFRVWYRGRAISIGGTSASAPAFTAIIALLNDARIAKGMPPLGFLNPLLYNRARSGFNDITVGNNPGCGTPGFNATKGWDPRLGTPDFIRLKELLAP